MIGLLSLAASVVPSIIGAFNKDAGDVADKVVKAGMELTGASTEEEAVSALNANPELLAKYKAKVLDIELAFYREDTKRMDIVNKTMRKEISGTGTFKTCWRPAFGWVMAFSWGVTVLSLMALLGYTVVKNPADLSDVIEAIADVVSAMVPLWFVAMSVLGVAVWKRSSDKKLSTNSNPSALGGVVDGIKNMLGK